MELGVLAAANQAALSARKRLCLIFGGTVTAMIKLGIAALALVLIGCASAKPSPHADVNRILVVSTPQAPGHSEYTVLGPVNGYCENENGNRQLTNVGDSIRGAAVRKYGTQVDAIVDAQSRFMVDNLNNDRTADFPLVFGHFQCMGTAVRFAGNSSQPASSVATDR